jgi:hypothetical protein
MDQPSPKANQDSRDDAPVGPASKRTRKPRNYFSRREQYRLLSLVFTLLLVMLFMSEAAKPKNWQWMWQLGGPSIAHDASLEEADIDTRLAPRTNETLPADVFVSKPNSEPPASNAAVPLEHRLPALSNLDFACLKDDTVFRGVESATWYGILGALAETSASELQRRSLGNVGFTQLFRQTAAYRGRTVTIRGTVHRAFPLEAGKNESGIDSYWQCWLQPDGSQNPIVVYSLEMPAGFPEGLSIRERVVWDGVFYKRWAYAAKEGTRTAPLVLAKRPEWTRAQATVTTPNANTRDIVGVTLASLAAALLLTWIIYVCTRTKNRNLPLDTIAPLLWFVFLVAPISLVAQENAPAPTDSTIDSLRSFLSLYDISDQHLADLGNAADPQSEAELTKRVFQCLRRCPPKILETDVYSLNEPESLAQAARGDFVRARGQLERIEPVAMPDELKDRYDAPFYSCSCLVPLSNGESQRIRLLANKIPKRWQARLGSVVLAEQVTLDGLVLRSPPTGELVLATERLRWHPQSISDDLEVTADHVLLGAHGLDIGQLDELRPKGPLSPHDRAAFYQTFLAVGRVPSAKLQSAATTVNVTDLLQNSEQHRGELYSLTGTVRRCVRILVDDDESKQYGISSYFELVLFLDPDAHVMIRSSKEAEGKHFSTYPVVVCVRQLPEGFPEGEEIHAACRVVGSYLKLWAYPSEFMQSGDSKSLQFSPLLIGNEPALVESAAQDPLSGPGLAIGFTVTLLFLAGLVGWWNRGDAKFKRETLSKKYELPEDVRLDHDSFGPIEETRFDE